MSEIKKKKQNNTKLQISLLNQLVMEKSKDLPHQLNSILINTIPKSKSTDRFFWKKKIESSNTV